jgi:hypothetical protein
MVELRKQSSQGKLFLQFMVVRQSLLNHKPHLVLLQSLPDLGFGLDAAKLLIHIALPRG